MCDFILIVDDGLTLRVGALLGLVTPFEAIEEMECGWTYREKSMVGE